MENKGLNIKPCLIKPWDNDDARTLAWNPIIAQSIFHNWRVTE